MKKASLISFVLLFIMAGPAVGDDWWWPPTDAAMVTPQNPTSSDVVAITLSGQWPHSCIPDNSTASVMGNDIFFDVIASEPGGACLAVITYWERIESVGPLPPGVYTVYARLIGDPFVPEVYMPMAEFTVRGPYYVDDDASGANNGSSWADAYNYLQDALAVAIYGDQIWVAQGTYYPTVEVGGSGERYRTFQMKNGVAIYGGFPDIGDPNWHDREPNMYVTILSGDIGTRGADSDNCYHVFYNTSSTNLDSTAVLDGFTITGGNANGPGDHDEGGGMHNYDTNPMVANCTFTANTALYGGGMFNDYCRPTITNCTFSGNAADYGGGMENWNANPRVTDCTFRSNVVDSGGGAMFNSHCSPTVANCSFSRNSAGTGGGMANTWHCQPRVTNCTFTGNTADDRGGAICNYTSRPRVTNCTFSANTAGDRGGGIYNWNSSGPRLTNCTFSANHAVHGNALACNSYNAEYPSTVQITNCILWDGDGQIWNNDNSNITVNYSDIQGGWSGTGNINAGPLFIDPDGSDNTFGTQDDNLRLSPGSPCIDAADNTAVPSDTADLDGDGNTTEPIPWDLDGNARIVDGNSDGNAVVDMGAYEFFISNTPPVATAGPNQIAYAWVDGIAGVVLDGNDSYDPDGDEMTYLWTWTIDSNTHEANGVNPMIELPVGEHTIELIVNDGIDDSQPDYVDVNVVAPLEANLRMMPRVINRNSRMPRIMAFVRLPEGITKNDIDSNQPLMLYPAGSEEGIEAIRQFILRPRRYGTEHTSIFAFFNKAELMDAVPYNGGVELQVVGSLKSGQYFYGSDKVWIIKRQPRWWRRWRRRR